MPSSSLKSLFSRNIMPSMRLLSVSITHILNLCSPMVTSTTSRSLSWCVRYGLVGGF